MSSLARGRRGREHGQVIVLFAIALVAIIAMVGLVLDGGSAYAQRRSEQAAADLAALAGANDYLLNSDANAAIARAKSVAATNGYLDGANGTTVNVSVDTSLGVRVTVDVGAPHENGFARVLGMSTWNVGATATALAGYPDTAGGAGPFIFSIHAFGTDGTPLGPYGDPNAPFDFGEGNGDVPNGPGDIAWTDYGSPANVNTNVVRGIIDGSDVVNVTLQFGEYIGQHNQGNHTALYGDVNSYLSGQELPVPVVDDNGNFQGWATFHVVSAEGGSQKHITGYFVSRFIDQKLTVGTCQAGTCPRYLGSYVLKLVN